MSLATADIPSLVFDTLAEAFEGLPTDGDSSMRLDAIPGWDSVSRIILIASIEGMFGVRLEGRDVRGMETIGDLVTLVTSRLSNGGADE